jgi:tetratricopeptide (TPR) repeat protein
MKNIKILTLLSFALLSFLISCQNEQKQPEQNFAKTGNPEIDALTEQIFKNQKQADLYYKRALLFFKDGEKGGYDFAIKDMQYALTIDSTNIKYHYFLSDIYLKYARSRNAVETMERAAALAPNDLTTQLKLAQLHFITKQYGLGIASLDKVLKQDPQNSEAYFLMGMIFKEQEDPNRAINAFQKAVDIDSDNKDAFLELGKLFTDKGSPLAIKYFDNALLIDSLDFNAMMAKAYYFQTKKETNKALDIYKNILAHDPRYEVALFNLGLIYFETDSLDKADAHFNMVIQESPTFYKAYYYHGAIAEKKGDKEAAIKNYKQALEFNSTYDKAVDAMRRLGK